MRAALVISVLAGVAPLAAAAGTSDAPHEVVLRATGAGWDFTDRAGMTLYVYDRDVTRGKSECEQTCAARWPPLLAPAGAKPHGAWSTVQRADGALQWAYEGKPLYRYAKDAYPRARFGERPENEAWHTAGEVIEMPPVASIAAFMGGKVLTTSAGLVLYALDTDRLSGPGSLRPGTGSLRPVSWRTQPVSLSTRGEQSPIVRSGCAAACLESWHPLEAGLLALPVGDWSIAVREDGTRQWTFRGKPLYTFADDRAKESLGEGRDGVWHRVMLEPPPAMPDWVKLQPTDGGLVAADPRGMTLYAYEADMNVNRPSGGASERGCNQYCLNLYHPVPAAPDAQAVGDWSIVMAADGGRQWAYKGLPLSTFAEDRQPGDIVGTKPYRVWHTISPTGIPMQGAGGG